ncbi:hypothetical protein [Pseudomonas sp. EL_65y_Pfl1_R83]|uniref:hypothetical protein n=1 Tax=Pseudomonas sp. EL_65y_Pfl1_R83 TaxID=3088697 RepID=UPI0030DBDA03
MKSMRRVSARCALIPHACALKEISTDIRFFDDTDDEPLEIAADTLRTGVEMYRIFFFFHDVSIFLQLICSDAEVAAIHTNRVAFYVRSAFSDNLK